MLFESLDEACDFYHRFAKQEGFAVSKRSTTKGNDGEVRFVTVTCCRGGKARLRTSNPVKPRPQTKIECPACICMVLQSEGKWKFNRVVLDHNHDQSPSKVEYLKCNRFIDEHTKRRLELNDRAGIKLNKTFDSLQIVGKLSCLCAKTNKTDFVSEYVVKEWINFGEGEDTLRKRVIFNVTFETETNETRCTCRLFESRGMVRRHQLLVWFQLDIRRVPEKYVLKRWCKNMKRAHTKVQISYDNSSRSIESERRDVLCKSFNGVLDLAEDSFSKFEMAMKGICELKQALMLASDDSVPVEDGVTRTHQVTNILDLKGLSRKGRPRKNRMQGVVEKIIKKNKVIHKKAIKSKKSVKEVDGVSLDNMCVTPHSLYSSIAST